MSVGQGSHGSLSGSLSYENVFLSSVFPSNFASTSRVSITVFGFEFASAVLSLALRVGLTGAESSAWNSASSVMCKSTTGTNLPGGDLVMAVTALVKVGTLSQAFTFNSPISSFLLANQPGCGKISSLTVFGSDFGVSATSLASRFGPTACESSQWTSDSTLRCLVVAGTFASLSAVVTVACAVDSASMVISYNMPRLASVKRISHVNSTVLIAKGSDLGTFQTSQAARSAATVCGATEWISDTILACRTKAGIVDSEVYGKVVVTSGRMVGSLSGAATYHGPVSALYPSNSHSRGGVVVIGLNFGLMDSTINIRLTGSSTESSAWLSYTTVACSCSSGISSNVSSLIITINRQKSTYSSSLSYDQISLSSVQASNLRRWSSVGLSVIGVNIGGFGLSPRIRLGGSDSVSTSWISDTFISCKLSPGFLQKPQLSVTLDRQKSTMCGCVSYDMPSVLLTQAIRSRLESETSSWIAYTSLKCKSASVASSRIVRDVHFKRLHDLFRKKRD